MKIEICRKYYSHFSSLVKLTWVFTDVSWKMHMVWTKKLLVSGIKKVRDSDKVILLFVFYSASDLLLLIVKGFMGSICKSSSQSYFYFHYLMTKFVTVVHKRYWLKNWYSMSSNAKYLVKWKAENLGALMLLWNSVVMTGYSFRIIFCH